MQITSRYILSRTTKPLIGAMTIGLLVLLAERMVRLLDVTLGKKNSFSLVFEMLAYLVPHYLGLAIPAAFFLGLLFGFNKLSKDSEVDAFMASGIGLHQLTNPALTLGKEYRQDEAISWGHLTVEEKDRHRLQRRRRSQGTQQ